jgi:hypothetical protein
MKTIAEEWEYFWLKVRPGDTPLIQFQEMQTAFYAGAICQLDLMLSIDLDNEEAGAHAIEKMKNELIAWIEDDLKRRQKNGTERQSRNHKLN